MRILRNHDQSIEQHPGYTCMSCLAKEDKVVKVSNGYPAYEILSPLKDIRAAHFLFDEIFTPFVWPGGYPIIFITDRGCVLCPDCAKKVFITERTDITTDIYYEGPTLSCDLCNEEIESAYGDPEDPD